ncbi:hypothetical protein X753_31120 [Mesorhizobium sp. LNJC399B00]|nr:hypothetical protein X753_31120 [Mesorhizobium sp. LNJC399B00]
MAHALEFIRPELCVGLRTIADGRARFWDSAPLRKAPGLRAAQGRNARDHTSSGRARSSGYVRDKHAVLADDDLADIGNDLDRAADCRRLRRVLSRCRTVHVFDTEAGTG